MSATLVWPFRTKDAAQYRRIDQGWDLEGAGPGEEDVLAGADGAVHYAHDPGGGGAHFGDPYPVLILAQSIDGNPAIYYGHTHPTLPDGTRVHQGDVIARTSSPGGGGAPDHWVEVGWWVSGPTGNGASMQRWLYDAPVFNPAPPPLPPTTVNTIQGDPDVAAVVNLNVPLGADGNGYNDLDGQQGRPLVPWAKVLGLFLNASDPGVNHRYSPIPAVAGDDFGGHARIVVEGGPASGTVMVHVTVAA